MISKSILWTGSIASSLLLAVTSFAMVRHVRANIKEPDISPAIQQSFAFDRCFPSTSAEPLLVRHTTQGKVSYWEVEAYSQNPDKRAIEFQHFRTEGTKCKWLNRNRVAFRLDYMPEPVAVDLATQYFAPMLAACKTQNQERKDVDTYCAGDMQMGLSGTVNNPQVFFPEEIKALQAMGIQTKLIQNVRLVARSTDIETDEF